MYQVMTPSTNYFFDNYEEADKYYNFCQLEFLGDVVMFKDGEPVK